MPPPAPTKKKVSFRKRFEAPRKLKLTREGKIFLGVTLGVGLAAINTANNLLYLLLGMLLGLIVVSGLMSELSLRNLTVVRRLPRRAQVGRPHLVEIEVFNHKKRSPSYAIEVEDLRRGQPADKRCFFLKISPQSAQVAAYRRTPSKRGRDVHTGFRVATRFPFGLFEKSRIIEREDELVIYPQVDAIRLRARVPGDAPGTNTRVTLASGDEVIGIRPMRLGEDPRDIHWKRSAAAGFLVLRERVRENLPEAVLGLDTMRPTESEAEWDGRFERRVREVASRAVAHLKRGDRVVIRTTSGATLAADRAMGADPVLRFLALLTPATERMRVKSDEGRSPA